MTSVICSECQTDKAAVIIAMFLSTANGQLNKHYEICG